MKADINLASGALVDSVRKRKALRILKIAAISSVVFIAVISISLFLLISQISPDKVKKQENKILSGIKVLRNRQAKISTITSRISDISKILNSRTSYDLEMETFLEKVPNDVSVNSFEIGKDKIGISVSSGSLPSIDEMLNNFIEMINNKQIIRSMAIQNFFSDQKSSTYSLSIKVNKL